MPHPATLTYTRSAALAILCNIAENVAEDIDNAEQQQEVRDAIYIVDSLIIELRKEK